MSYTPPSGDSLLFGWQSAPSYTPPDSDALDFRWGGLVAEPVWDDGDLSYRIEASWSEADGATGYRLALYQGETLLEEVDTASLTHAFEGLDAETTYLLVLTPYDAEGDLDPLEEEVTTPIGLPGGVTSLQHSFTTDSLTFIWDAAKGAEGYDLTLSLDGTKVATQSVTALTATFSGLKDGTTYTLDLHAYNAQGSGPAITNYDATTGYAIPSPPINLRQFEERIISVICRWDLAEPDKTFDVQLQLLYGNELLFNEVIEPEQTERTFNVPMASTDYLLRVRAGNPAGWSDWAEGTVSSETFPLIDSRLGVMAATYQEDALYSDTWDGASDQLKGVVEQVSADVSVAIDNYALTTTYVMPVVYRLYSDEAFGLAPSVAQGSINLRSIRLTHDTSDTFGMAPLLSAGNITIEVKRFLHTTDDAFGIAPSLDTATIDTVVKRFLHTDDDTFGVAPALDSATIDTVIP